MQVGSNYFRIHPKGVGLLCARQEGLPPLTFVEEYLGEVHAPWRWFEMQVGASLTIPSDTPFCPFAQARIRMRDYRVDVL